MFRQIIDLVVVAAFAVCAGAGVFLDIDQPLLRVLLALPLVFVLPGYALTASIFSKWKFGMAERLLLSLGLSLAATALGGLVLNFTPWGLEAGSWVAWLSGITLLFAVPALVVRLRMPVPALPTGGLQVKVVPVALTGLALLIATAAVALSQIPVPANGVQGYTQLWILPVPETGQDALGIGVSSMELKTVRYQLKVEMDGEVTHEWDSLELDPGEVFETVVSFPEGGLGEGPVKALLYRLDAPPGRPYRHVEYWPQQPPTAKE